MGGGALLERSESAGIKGVDSYHSAMAGEWPAHTPVNFTRRWLPPAIIGAAALIAAALVAAAIIISGNKSDVKASDASSATCAAWPISRAALYAIAPLPDGWDWNTPNIDTYITNRNAAVTRALDLFEPRITALPAEVSSAAHDYVTARRTEVRMLQDRTYSEKQVVESVMAAETLDRLCGIKDDS